MGALLKFLLIGLLGLWLWYSPAVRKLWGGSPQRGTGAGSRGTAKGSSTPESMVRCAYCGVHLPHSEALMSPEGHAYCCTVHRDQARQQTRHG